MVPSTPNDRAPVCQSGKQSSEEIRHGEQVHDCAKSEGNDEADSSAYEGNDQRFQEKLAEDATRGSSHGFAHSDFARPFLNSDEHDVHHAESAEEQRHDADRAEEIFHAVGHGAECFRFLDGVPDGAGFFVRGIVVVKAGEHAAEFVLCRLRAARPIAGQPATGRRSRACQEVCRESRGASPSRG